MLPALLLAVKKLVKLGWPLSRIGTSNIHCAGKKERIEKVEAKERAAEELRRKLKEEEESSEKAAQPEITDPDQSEVTDTTTGKFLFAATYTAQPHYPALLTQWTTRDHLQSSLKLDAACQKLSRSLAITLMCGMFNSILRVWL